jgi:hypothetical protein
VLHDTLEGVNGKVSLVFFITWSPDYTSLCRLGHSCADCVAFFAEMRSAITGAKSIAQNGPLIWTPDSYTKILPLTVK